MSNDPPLPIDPAEHIPDVLLGQANNSHQVRNNVSPPHQISQSPEIRQQFQPMVFPDSNTQTHGSKLGSGYPSQRTSPEEGQRRGMQPQSQAPASHITPRPAGQPVRNRSDQDFGFVPIPEHILPQSMVIAQREYIAKEAAKAAQKQAQSAHQPVTQAPSATHISGGHHDSQSPPLQHLPSAQSHGLAHSTVERTPRHNAADDYLDRVDHDPALQNMLSGVHAGSFHPRAHPDHGGQMSDKPLPDPLSPSNRTRAPSTAMGTHHGGHEGKSRRRESLSNGINPAMMMPTIPDGDRYPLFPGTGPHGGMQHVGHRRTHSRNTSIGSVDPAGFALPPLVSVRSTGSC